MSAIAISEMTRVERSQAWLNAALPLGAPGLRLSVRLVRKAAKAGARLHRAPVARARNRAKATTPVSMEMESTRGIDSGKRCTATRIAAAANARPSRPPDSTEQQAFENGFAENDAGTGSEGQTDSVLAAASDSPHQQQTSDVATGNQQHHEDGGEQGVQQWPRIGYRDLRAIVSRHP